MPRISRCSTPARSRSKPIWLIGAKARCALRRRRRRPRCRAAASASRPQRCSPAISALILYTSGTTGPSKGVCCPHAQYFWWAVNTASLLQLRDGDVLCTSLPLFHTNALNTFYQALLTGACVRYEKRFSASGFFPSLVQSRATVTYLLGAMVPILLSRPVSPEETAHQRADRARARRAGAVPRGIHAAHRHPPARRLGLDRNQFRSRHDDRAPAARIDGAGVRGLRCARGRRPRPRRRRRHAGRAGRAGRRAAGIRQ